MTLYNIKSHPNVAWSFLLHAGYLKACDRELVGNRYRYNLKIPNREVEVIYENMLKEWFEDDVKAGKIVSEVLNSLLNKDMEMFSMLLEELYLKMVSYNDLSLISVSEEKERQENFHHGFMLGLMMYAEEVFEIKSNRDKVNCEAREGDLGQYGLGRPDIVLISKKQELAYVFEFKWGATKASKTLEMLTELAEKQIRDGKYIEGVKATTGVKDVTGIGIGFRGKEIKISYVE